MPGIGRWAWPWWRSARTACWCRRCCTAPRRTWTYRTWCGWGRSPYRRDFVWKTMSSTRRVTAQTLPRPLLDGALSNRLSSSNNRKIQGQLRCPASLLMEILDVHLLLWKRKPEWIPTRLWLLSWRYINISFYRSWPWRTLWQCRWWSLMRRLPMVLRWTSYQRRIIIIIIIAWPDCIMLVNKDAPFVYFFLVRGPPAEQNLCSAILYELYLDTYLRGMVVDTKCAMPTHLGGLQDRVKQESSRFPKPQ
jgi:hypothetical protein